MKHYLGISCEEYQNLDNISFCHSDSIKLCETLTKYCDYDKHNCECVTPYIGDADNSGPNLLKKIETICNMLDAEDVFLLFFAGHGCAHNGDAILLLPDYDGTNDAHFLSLKGVRDIFSRAKGFCVAIIDACHSGMDISSIVLEKEETRGKTENGWAILASCTGNEVSYPYVEKEQGAFSYFLSDCIEQWECKGEITVEALKRSVCEEMDRWCAQTGKMQNPTMNCSIAGKQIIAIRNLTKSKNQIIAVAPKRLMNEDKEKMNEILITDSNKNTLWNANTGIAISKDADTFTMLSANVMLPEKTIKALKRNYTENDYESVSEIIWDKALGILRERILSMGVELVGEMVGLDNEAYVRELPAFEVINLATELGFIDATGKMRLTQANELVLHYRDNKVNEEMAKNEIETIIRACVQYILAYDDTSTSYEFSDFRNSLKREVFSSSRLEVLKPMPYFYKKTTIRTLINLINTTEGAEYEVVATNFVSVIEAIWESLSSDDRYMIGINYSQYVNEGDSIRTGTYKYALERVRGFDYVPENLRSLSFIYAAKYLKKIHYGFNNFYNEPEAVKRLERLGTQIPRPAIKECVSACLICLSGNVYGCSDGAIDTLKKILNKLDKNAWLYYLDDCFAYDEDFLINISNADNRTQRWCQLVKEYELEKLNVKDGKMQEMLVKAYKQDKENTKAYVISLLKKINKY